MAKKPQTWVDKAFNKKAFHKAMQNPESRQEINNVIANFKKQSH